MPQNKWAASFLLCCVLTAHLLNAETTPTGSKPQSDVLILTDGEKIIGQLQRASNSSVVFKSEILGELTMTGVRFKSSNPPKLLQPSPKE